MRRIFFVLAACMLFAISACTKSDTAKTVSVAKEKSPAPEISVVSLADGSVTKLSALKGKVVMLNFWATWCPPCREEMPSMVKLNNAMNGKPFQMVAVSIDEGGKQDVESFLKESGHKLPVYLDPDGNASKQYGITGVPETFIIDKQGVIVKKVIGGLAWDSPEVASFLEGLMK
ncbi:MAG: TlpA disulfide reductase family protein [Geobacteraceae bacterium]|nr:TlpA disulfide reductase family protein [Geobacteraceae bacterium]